MLLLYLYVFGTIYTHICLNLFFFGVEENLIGKFLGSWNEQDGRMTFYHSTCIYMWCVTLCTNGYIFVFV